MLFRSLGELPKQQNKLSRRPDLNISIAGYIFIIPQLTTDNALKPPGGIRSRRYIDNQNRLRTPALGKLLQAANLVPLRPRPSESGF